MDFDPLSLFTPSPSVEDDIRTLEHKEVKEIPYEDEDDHLQPIHILDLPLLKLNPPFEVVMIFLKLFQPSQVTNFYTTAEDEKDPDSIFKEKGIYQIELDLALVWLRDFCPRFNTISKLAAIPRLSNSFKLINDYNSYFTRLISTPLPYTDAQISLIHKEASLRVSENCGRTAQPQIIRKIKLDDFEEVISLKEPSLTNDNLGLKTWGSSLILSNRLIRNPEKYLKGEVLELGSGTGLTGIVISKLGYNVILTDLPEITPNLRENCKLNKCDSLVCELDWSDPTSFIKQKSDIKFDTIMLSDPIYSSKHPYWVVNMIKLFSKSTSNIIVQIPLRPKFEKEREVLWELLSDYKVVEEAVESGYDDFGVMQFLFKLYNL
ncbi:unnamed protein product [Candida verbasci]|uniref:Uncharacterized protein n=1 Tax=Candida verbasci TaxID=1227364 RepID=A0A9W4TW43_9ASCO|nr:unnamed protein product [Candida verbasci]